MYNINRIDDNNLDQCFIFMWEFRSARLQDRSIRLLYTLLNLIFVFIYFLLRVTENCFIGRYQKRHIAVGMIPNKSYLRVSDFEITKEAKIII